MKEQYMKAVEKIRGDALHNSSNSIHSTFLIKNQFHVKKKNNVKE